MAMRKRMGGLGVESTTERSSTLAHYKNTQCWLLNLFLATCYRKVTIIWYAKPVSCGMWQPTLLVCGAGQESTILCNLLLDSDPSRPMRPSWTTEPKIHTFFHHGWSYCWYSPSWLIKIHSAGNPKLGTCLHDLSVLLDPDLKPWTLTIDCLRRRMQLTSLSRWCFAEWPMLLGTECLSWREVWLRWMHIAWVRLQKHFLILILGPSWRDVFWTPTPISNVDAAAFRFEVQIWCGG